MPRNPRLSALSGSRRGRNNEYRRFFYSNKNLSKGQQNKDHVQYSSNNWYTNFNLNLQFKLTILPRLKICEERAWKTLDNLLLTFLKMVNFKSGFLHNFTRDTKEATTEFRVSGLDISRLLMRVSRRSPSISSIWNSRRSKITWKTKSSLEM